MHGLAIKYRVHVYGISVRTTFPLSLRFDLVHGFLWLPSSFISQLDLGPIAHSSQMILHHPAITQVWPSAWMGDQILNQLYLTSYLPYTSAWIGPLCSLLDGTCWALLGRIICPIRNSGTRCKVFWASPLQPVVGPNCRFEVDGHYHTSLNRSSLPVNLPSDMAMLPMPSPMQMCSHLWAADRFPYLAFSLQDPFIGQWVRFTVPVNLIYDWFGWHLPCDKAKVPNTKHPHLTQRSKDKGSHSIDSSMFDTEIKDQWLDINWFHSFYPSFNLPLTASPTSMPKTPTRCPPAVPSCPFPRLIQHGTADTLNSVQTSPRVTCIYNQQKPQPPLC